MVRPIPFQPLRTGRTKPIRTEKVQLLRGYQGMLQSLQQTPIAQLKTKLDIWRPDILLMFDQLVLFAELWSYVRLFNLKSL